MTEEFQVQSLDLVLIFANKYSMESFWLTWFIEFE